MRQLIFVVYLFPFLLQAQTISDSFTNDSIKVEIVKIELKDGSTLIGQVISEDENTIVFKTTSGIKMDIPRVEIKKQAVVTDKIKKGEIWENDPNQTRLFFSPTGRPLDKGEGYFAVYELFFPFLAVGITDNLTLAGGMSLFLGADEQLLYIAPKYTFLKKEKVNLSAGILFMKIPDVDQGAGIVYGVGTFGDRDKAVTVGLGYGFSGGDFANSPVITLGGELRAGKNTKFISENWIFTSGTAPLFSLGLRFFGEKLAADFGLMAPPEADVMIPWLGFAYNF